MRYQLVIQTVAGSIGDYDMMIALEEEIERRLGDIGIVDGHDMGVGEANIFLIVTDPTEAFSRIAPALPQALPGLKVAYRELEGTKYVTLFPPGLTEFHIR